MKARIFCVLLAVLTAQGFGLGFRIVDHGAEATARGGAFVATADNASAVYYNPAAITQLDGVQLLLNAYSVNFESIVDPSTIGALDVDSKYKWETVGDFFLTWKPGSQSTMSKDGKTLSISESPVAFGLGVYSPFGLSNEYPEDAVFNTIGQKGRIQFLTINPVIAYQITKELSVAVGVTLNYSRAKLARAIGFTPGDQFQLEGDGYGTGVTAGIFWKPTPQHAFGVQYFGPIDMRYSGHARTRVPGFEVPFEPIPGFVIPVQFPRTEFEQDIDVEIDYPETISAGYSFRPTEDWNFEFDVEWTNWDRLNNPVISFSKSPVDPLADLDVPLNFKYESSFIYEFGVTKTFTGGWRVSAGYLYSENSVPNPEFNPLVPDSNRHVISAGVGRRYEHWDWFLTYQYAYGPHRDIDQQTVADGSYRAQSHAISFSLGYRF
jgi:long-chain fatty acid transport protein